MPDQTPPNDPQPADNTPLSAEYRGMVYTGEHMDKLVRTLDPSELATVLFTFPNGNRVRTYRFISDGSDVQFRTDPETGENEILI